jgi:hypothetical protein
METQSGAWEIPRITSITWSNFTISFIKEENTPAPTKERERERKKRMTTITYAHVIFFIFQIDLIFKSSFTFAAILSEKYREFLI